MLEQHKLSMALMVPSKNPNWTSLKPKMTALMASVPIVQPAAAAARPRAADPMLDKDGMLIGTVHRESQACRAYFSDYPNTGILDSGSLQVSMSEIIRLGNEAKALELP